MHTHPTLRTPLLLLFLSSLTMAPKRPQQMTQSSDPATATTPKPPRAAWKTGEQLEFLLSHWSGFVHHQNEKSLDRFWPKVYYAWYLKWPITPSSESIMQHGNPANATLVLRTDNNTVSVSSSYSHNSDNLFFIREFVRGFITTVAQTPRPANPICGLPKARSESLPPLKLIACMPGRRVYGKLSSPGGTNKNGLICQQTTTIPPLTQSRRLVPARTSPSISSSRSPRKSSIR